MLVEQIAVFLENKSGRLAEITAVLAENNINIRALSVADTADFGILRLIVDNVEKAKSVLKENGFILLDGTNFGEILWQGLFFYHMFGNFDIEYRKASTIWKVMILTHSSTHHHATTPSGASGFPGIKWKTD